MNLRSLHPASLLADPVVMRKLNGWLTVIWILMIPVSYELGWLKSVTYVSALSLWALVTGHLSTWQAARVEVAQHRDANVADVIRLLQESKSVDTSQTDVSCEELKGD